MKLHLNNRPDSLLVHSCVLGRAGNCAGQVIKSDVTKSGAENSDERYRIKIAGIWYEQSVILTPQSVELWDVDDVSAMNIAHFQRLAELDAEVVIFGAGKRAVFPHGALTRPLMHKRIGLEVMDTAAACRTYNILAGDGRVVVAALIV